MKRLTEENYRSLFKATVIMKGLFALGELLLGLALAFFSYDSLRRAVIALTGDELTERPLDFLWHYAAQGLHGFIATPQAVWAFIFTSHGVIKLIVVIALLKEKMWAYPVGVVVFGFFIAYQFFQMMQTPSAALFLVTILDIFVVGFIIHEWRWRRRHGWRKEQSFL
jgi:uncharacterized membrane protein